MKFKFLVPAFLLVASQAAAIIRTVSNNPVNLAQFNTIQAAIDASASGDSIFIHGSPVNYAGGSAANKTLAFIGPGFYPKKDLPFVATIISSLSISGNCSGSEFQGLRFLNQGNGGEIVINGSQSNMRIIRNTFEGAKVSLLNTGGTFSNFYFEGNFFTHGGNQGGISSTGSVNTNFMFVNNVFCYTRDNGEGQISFSNKTLFLMNHNLFYGPPAATNCTIFDNSNAGVSFTNNIFIHRHPAGTPGPAVYSNNITFECLNNTPWLANGSADNGGNQANVSPQMVNQAEVNNGNVSAIYNFRIATGTAKNAGGDSRDIGLMYDAAGRYNYEAGWNSLLPRVISMSLPNPAIPVGGTLEVNLKAVKAN